MQRIVANIIDRVLGRREACATTTTLSQMRKLSCHDGYEDRPHARSGHRLFTDDDYIYVIGGFSNDPNEGGHIYKQIWRYNILTQLWSEVNISPFAEFPEALASHTVVQVLPFSSHIICFGGSQIPFGQTNSNSAYLISINQNRANSFQLDAASPHENGIYGHAMCASRSEENVFYIVGGTTGHDYYCDIYKLTLLSERTCTWERLDRFNNQRGLYRLEIAHDEIKNRLLLLGGGSPDFAETFEQINVFDLCSKTFERLTTFPDDDEFPSSRRSHSLVRYGRHLVMAGGCAPPPENLMHTTPLLIREDVWRLDMDTLQWKRLGNLMQPVYFHDATVTSDGMMVIWGGVTSADSTSRTNEGQFMWLSVPNLKTLSAQILAKMYPDIFSRPVEELRMNNMKGIFKQFINNVYMPEFVAPAS